MITKEKFQIYIRFNGDSDGFSRVASYYENEMFNNHEWALIDKLLHHIELINKNLAAQTFINATLLLIKENCDEDSLEIITDKIIFYKYFQQVAGILRQIKTFISQYSDTVWAGFDNANEFLEELNQDIESIETCDYQALQKIHVEFLPTSTYQELSISNGWSDNYIKLSNDFDKLYEKLTEILKTKSTPLPKIRRTWWQKLFGYG